MAPQQEEDSTQSSKSDHPQPVLSKRGKHTADYEDFLVGSLVKASNDPYHQKNNPKGIVNMGTAVNSLMEEELATRLMQGDCLSFTSNHQHYFDFSGVRQLKEAVANFLTRHLHPRQPIIPQNLIVMNGVTSCLDAMSHVLCDPNDVVITPTPVYGRIFTDVHDAAQANVEPLHLKQDEDGNGESFGLNPEDLESRIVFLKESGKRVRAFIFLHPQNPLGDVYSPQLLTQLLHICAKYEVHFICDEIYAMSVFDEETKFQSILTLDLPDPSRTHFIWGFSKDFGLAGLRVGVIYSFSEEVVRALTPLSTYKCVPHVVQQAAAAIVNDIAWCDEYFLPTNTQRLRKAYEWAWSRFQSMGVKVRRSKGGLFIWICVQEYLKHQTEEDEMELQEEFLDAGLYIVPGTKLYCQVPGWFRLVFSVLPHELEVGLDRLELVLKARKEKNFTSSDNVKN